MPTAAEPGLMSRTRTSGTTRRNRFRTYAADRTALRRREVLPDAVAGFRHQIRTVTDQGYLCAISLPTVTPP